MHIIDSFKDTSLFYCLYRPVKFYLTSEVTFGREHPDGSTRNTTAYQNSESAILLNQSQTAVHIENAIRWIDTLADVFTNEGSGWTVDHIGNVTLHMESYDAIGGSSHIPTYKWLENKRATVNIKNKDNYCFLYCILTVSHYQKTNPDRASHYSPYLCELNVQGLTFPVEIDQIHIF